MDLSEYQFGEQIIPTRWGKLCSSRRRTTLSAGPTAARGKLYDERIVLTCGESEIAAPGLLCLQNIYVPEMPHATALIIPLASQLFRPDWIGYWVNFGFASVSSAISER